VQVSYEAARRAKSHFLGDSLDMQAQQYRQLPAYLNALAKNNPGVITRLLINEVTHRFERLFICPKESGQAHGSWRYLRKLVAVDGTHLKGGFVHTLMLAVGIDAENQIVPLAWAVVESENERSWRWFLSPPPSAKLLISAVGGIADGVWANKILEEKGIDCVRAARAFLRNPGFAVECAEQLGVTVEWPTQYHRRGRQPAQKL
jgi:hypothetical protein